MTTKTANPKVKAFLEYGPLIGFFAAYLWLKDEVFTIGGTEYAGFIAVTAGFIPIFLLSILALWKVTGKLSLMQVVTAVVIVVFGGLSVWLNDERFFKMKPTLLYVMFGAALSIGLMRGQSWLEKVMDGMMPLQHAGWMLLTKRITVFFFGLAALNEVVWRTQSTETWVYFKTFGLTVAILVFFISQSGLIQKYADEDSGDDA